MEQRTSSAARLFAALALVVAVLAVVGVIAAGMSGSDTNDGKGSQGGQQTQHKKRHRTEAKTYTVESGDTLTAIAHKTGVPVAEILALNPEVDPQILIAGQTLQLK